MGLFGTHTAAIAADDPDSANDVEAAIEGIGAKGGGSMSTYFLGSSLSDQPITDSQFQFHLRTFIVQNCCFFGVTKSTTQQLKLDCYCFSGAAC